MRRLANVACEVDQQVLSDETSRTASYTNYTKRVAAMTQAPSIFTWMCSQLVDLYRHTDPVSVFVVCTTSMSFPFQLELSKRPLVVVMFSSHVKLPLVA